MRTNHDSIKVKFRIFTILGLSALLGAQIAGLAGANAASPFGQKEQSLQYRLTGVIVNVQGDTFLVRKPTGETVKLTITENTNMFCEDPSGPSQKSIVSGNADFTPDKGSTKGFRIGNCPPVPGQYIKAETTDVGMVTFLRTVDPGRVQDQTERLGLPQNYSVDGYAVFPVVREGLGQKALENHDVHTADGNKLGNLKKIIIDTKTGTILYGVVELDQEAIQTKGMEIASGSFMPLPWSTFQSSGKEEAMKLELTSQQLTHVPGYGEDMTVADIRAYWELQDPQGRDIDTPTPRYRGADRTDKLELERARENYKAARAHFLNLDTVYGDDIKELERAREKMEIAFEQYLKGGGEKTIQQKLQSQIFR
jgi:sporulation protein YlmC with PRC-barrel domain